MSDTRGLELRYGKAEEAGMLSEGLDAARELARDWVDQDILNSVVMLVARRGIIVLHEAFGRLNFEPDSPPVDLDTIYLLTSLTKPVTATALMCLVEDGLVKLDSPVVDYIPEFVGEGKDKVLIRHLLTHTSGITDSDASERIKCKRGKVEIPACEPTQHPGLNETLFLMYDVPLSLDPGKLMRYSDRGYDLLGEIIRRVSGKSLHGFSKERIFDKLGMKDSYFETPDHIRHRVARCSLKLVSSEYDDNRMDLPQGCCGLISTVMDMVIFTQMFLNKGVYGGVRVISPSSVIEMTRNQLPGISARFGDEFFPEANWSCGWGLSKYWFESWPDRPTLQSSVSFGHGGWGTVYLWGDPAYEIAGAFFTTSNNKEKSYDEPGLFINAVISAIANLEEMEVS